MAKNNGLCINTVRYGQETSFLTTPDNFWIPRELRLARCISIIIFNMLDTLECCKSKNLVGILGPNGKIWVP